MTRRPSDGSLLALLLGGSAALRTTLMLLFPGFLTGDDVEVLAQAFHRALGYPYAAWNIRSLLLPDTLVAPFVALAHGFGIDDPAAQITVATVPFILAGTASVFLVFALAKAWTPDRATALVAALLYSVHPLALGYSSMPYPRVVSTTCVLAATLLVARRAPPWTACFAAGTLVSVAFTMRYSEVIFLAPILILVWFEPAGRSDRVRRLVATVLGSGLGIVVLVGVYDALTWGEPFASLVAFAKYTLADQSSSSLVASQSPWFYLKRLPHWLPLTLVPFMVVWWRQRHLRWRLSFVVIPVMALSLLHHKETRYLQAMVPFLVILAAAGATAMCRRNRRGWVAGLVAASVLLSLAGCVFLDRKSSAATAAARSIAAQADSGPVALSQAWAYGGRLFLGPSIEVREVGAPPRSAPLRTALDGARWAALYAIDLTRDPELRSTLTEQGFVQWRRFERGRSRSVVVFLRGAGATDADR